ncbi:hypothetical protein GGTG_07886 [Gaeumannomyces tritici R3-111a-1]|uniref:Mediator of RNA polymerase II transcription subunit 6 n=1 Tax=Gaeumannomyces tritici (strain R3-111a-1) TaxID=644352 RepID=J3P2Z5_GAET3|nr:hypothetical protein GGTG_07886 [Gaeumannomyces tritici R3-111a-1]EJT74037.1 hypothetical protein GGTG_07886 [Gaeumannomyces tritici R3-111a-1]
MDNKTEQLLDEIQWSSPQSVVNFQGIHSNSVLYYLAESPFFDRTSNNAVVFNQAVRNQSMLHIVATREAFEGRLREMAGLEYMVAQEPAETGPGAGTGVWVIRKQTRRKVKAADGTPLPDELEVHADYFVMGENIYMAPSLSDVLSSRIATISSAISKLFPAVSAIQTWTPALGHGYATPAAAAAAPRPRGLESKEPTPMPDSLTPAAGAGAASKAPPPSARTERSAPDARMAEEAFAIHTRYGGEYMDENPITGKPGEFHLSSTGRKDKLTVPVLGGPGGAAVSLPVLKTLPDSSPLSKDIKPEKAAKAGGPPKPKRRKSKGGTTTPS